MPLQVGLRVHHRVAVGEHVGSGAKLASAGYDRELLGADRLADRAGCHSVTGLVYGDRPALVLSQDVGLLRWAGDHPVDRLLQGCLVDLGEAFAYREERRLVAPAVSFFSLLADPLPQLAMLVLVCAVALRRGLPRLAVASVVLVAGANLTTQVLKTVLSHHRYQPVLGYRQIGPTAFPSGHATASLAMACAFVLVVPPRWRTAAIVLGALATVAVGCSRWSATTTTRAMSSEAGWWRPAGASPSSPRCGSSRPGSRQNRLSRDLDRQAIWA